MNLANLFKETVELRDGRTVLVRPIRAADAPLLVDLHNRLSTESQYMRFFGAKPHLTPEEAEYLAGVDFDRRFAIVACVEEDDTHRIVAVGRFDLTDPATAEAAVVVRDDYQRQGLGTAILERMVEVARGRGVRVFAGEILAENDRMLRLLKNNGLELGRVEDSVVRVGVPIDETPPVLRALKLVAPYMSGLIDAAVSLRRKRQSS